MRAIITNEDIGTTIDFRSAGPYAARHPWPEETVVSAGLGVVFTRGNTPNYRTLFVECYPPGAGFLRGEGATPEECEDAVWAKYQLALHCAPGHDEHQWEPRGYPTGAGFCAHCETFKTRCFTGEQLGQYCTDCGAGTTYAWSKVDDEIVFTCEAHTPKDTRTDEEIFEAIFGDADQQAQEA